MIENNKKENINRKRVLLAGASLFIIMPVFLFVLEKIISSYYLSNPKLFIGIVVGGAILIDAAFVKLYKKTTSNEKNT